MFIALAFSVSCRLEMKLVALPFSVSCSLQIKLVAQLVSAQVWMTRLFEPKWLGVDGYIMCGGR